ETKYDELNFGKVFTVNYDKDGDGYIDQDGIGEFGASGSVSWNSFWSGGANFGGVEITKTFAYAQNGVSLNVSTTNKAIVSFAKYTVTYMDEPNGTVLGEVTGVRAALNPNSERSQYVDEIAAVTVPEKRGYTGVWAHEEVRSNMTVYPVYTPNFYSVLFQSAQKIDGWDYDSASNTYFLVRDMLYGAEVRLYEGNRLADGAVLNGQLNPYVVTDGDNVVVLPEYDTGRVWTRFDISASAAEFFSYNTPDIITYKSDVAFSIGSTDCGTEYSLEYENEFVLPDAGEVSCAEGYVFLGWYQKTDAGWVQVTELTYSHGRASETVVEALWQVSATSLNVTGKRSGVAHYTNTINVSPEFCVLKGAFADDDTVSQSVEYYYRLTSTTTSTVIDATTAETTYTC
ncbi:MAG: hypothetical protein K2H43_01110, partial [Clostridia bacterium]|nr:hypothetical protein [Clostridia bacterium]